MDTLKVNGSWTQFTPYLRDRMPFNKYGNLYGRTYLLRTGILPHEHAITLRVLYTDSRLAYVVYSYDTPIAWRDTDGNWTVPDVKYSTTTSKHQGRIGMAVSQL